MQEVIARGGKVLLITNQENNIISENIRFSLVIPKTDYHLTSFLTTIPLQLLAYHIASLKNLDIDKPRNLAKSVTVE
jgi:glucosamine--fructose-6-phosphate aminotransferase (isomerizing)